MVEALPTHSVPALRARGVMQVVSPDELAQHEQNVARAQAQVTQAGNNDQMVEDQLSGYIRGQFDIMRRHRSTTAGWNDRLLKAQRAFRGEYDPGKLAEIKKFGGSEVYARVTAAKCRGATSLLREVYLGPEKPWGLEATPDPVLPDDITSAVSRLVQNEVQGLIHAGQSPDVNTIKDRINSLMDAAKLASKKKAQVEAQKAEDKLDTLLIEGTFYKALAEFLSDLPLFPFACVKGPVVRIVPTVEWVQGRAVQQLQAKMFWSRVSPFDIYFTPGVSDILDADVIERSRLTRMDLNDLLGLPGYNEDNIRQVLENYSNGLHDWLDPTDAERAQRENKENPHLNMSALIDCLEFHGNVQGKLLLNYGMTPEEVPDELRDYFIQAWVIGRYVIKVQLSPSPRKRHPYYITSFEKVPGTVVGNALPDILEDIQDVCNASLRSLVNNLSISSGPQVVVNLDRLSPNENGQEMFPWKRWFTNSDPASNGQGQPPITFFQPQSNANELLAVYEKFTQIADELSAIPRYITGSDRMGGAGRTASGLAMLMGNASKILQTVAANVDRDVVDPLLHGLYDMVMLTDQSGTFRGDENINVRGVDVAVQRETNRQRQLEFLQVTANPIDTQIMGPEGRAVVLRTVAHTIGIDGDNIVPSEDDMAAKAKAAAAAQAGATPGTPGTPGSAGNQPPPSASGGAHPGIQMPRHGNQAPMPKQPHLGVDQANQSRAIAPTPGRISS